MLTGEAEPERAARALARTAGAEVVVTVGARGAYWSDGHELEHGAAGAPAAVRHADAALDTTGAGDAFAAGWLAARRRGAPVDEALRAANALGARAVARPGGRAGRH